MRTEQVNEMIADITRQLLQKRSSDGIWRGCLSSSAISTSVAIFALYQIDSDTYEPYIRKGAGWLKKTMRADGSWGDSVESPSNMTATLLSYASLYAVDIPPHETETYLKERLGGNTDEDIVQGVLSYYGKDLTFSVPILVMCALAGVITHWDRISAIALYHFPRKNNAKHQSSRTHYNPIHIPCPYRSQGPHVLHLSQSSILRGNLPPRY